MAAILSALSRRPGPARPGQETARADNDQVGIDFVRQPSGSIHNPPPALDRIGRTHERQLAAVPAGRGHAGRWTERLLTDVGVEEHGGPTSRTRLAEEKTAERALSRISNPYVYHAAHVL